MQILKENLGHHIFTFPSYIKCRVRAAREAAHCRNLQHTTVHTFQYCSKTQGRKILAMKLRNCVLSYSSIITEYHFACIKHRWTALSSVHQKKSLQILTTWEKSFLNFQSFSTLTFILLMRGNMVQTAKYEHLLLFLSIIAIILFKVLLRKYHLI